MRMAFCIPPTVTFLQPYTDVYPFTVAGMSTAADSIVCMEMNQMFILQPCGVCTGCMVGSLLFQATQGHIRQLNGPRSVLCFLSSFNFNLSLLIS